MTGIEELSYRRITENIAGKLDLLEAYLFYCLALCSDCYTMVSNVKQESLTQFYGIKNDDQIRKWLHKFEDLNLIQLARVLNISESSVSRYLKQAEDSGYIKRDDKGIHLKNKKIFIVTPESTFAFIKNVYPNILTDEDISERRIHN